MRVHFIMLTACVIAATKANPTSAPLFSTEHLPSHVPSQGATNANPTSASHASTGHLTTHVASQAATNANPTSAFHGSKDRITTHVLSHAATDANPTSAFHGSTYHITHVSSHAPTDANPTSASHVSTDHIIPTHVPSHAATDANPTSVPPSLTTKHLPTHVPPQAPTNANPTSASHVSTDHITHVPSHAATDANKPTAPPADHITTHALSQGSPTEVHKSIAKPQGFLSKPAIHYNVLGNTVMHITCFSKSGPLPIRYQLFINDHIQHEKVVSKSEPANFTIPMTPGTQVHLNCTAIGPTGEKSSSKEKLLVDKDDFPFGTEEPETDQKDKDTGPEYLIPLQHILTSVTPDVLERNTLVMIISGSIILLLMVFIKIIINLRDRKVADISDDEQGDLSFYENLSYYQHMPQIFYHLGLKKHLKIKL
ncbi:uncharacterized protein [Dendropsophus ebraccatus]|uniref:uncharacterized protein isoform X2 n=1 Tax=Dendropsophus ebraccatus TaxID=150705 RepID=UPI0038319BCD